MKPYVYKSDGAWYVTKEAYGFAESMCVCHRYDTWKQAMRSLDTAPATGAGYIITAPPYSYGIRRKRGNHGIH